METKSLLVIIGPTASGKTALAIELAQKFDGEIICADSRTVYKDMDIGTAKPSQEEQELIPHHLLDVIEADQSFSAAKFKQLANSAIKDIQNRDKLPILVGGTGLYIDSVIYDFQFLPPADPAERQRLNHMSVQELQEEILEKQLPMPENRQNPRHLARVIETSGAVGRQSDIRPNTLVIGLDVDLAVLRKRITERVDLMLESGFIAEVETLVNRYGADAPGLLAPGYKAFKDYIENKISLDDAKAQFVRNDYLLARRQRTWFKRNKSIHWLNNREDAVELVTTFLNKKQ